MNAPAEPPVNEQSNGDDDRSSGGDLSDVIVSAVVAVLLWVGLGYFTVRYPGPVSVPLFILSGLLGASLGWVVGILASPYDPTEKSAFGRFGQLIYGFLSGYALSKLDPVLQNAISSGTMDTWVVACVGLISFLIAVALTYISRRYWAPPARPRSESKEPTESQP